MTTKAHDRVRQCALVALPPIAFLAGVATLWLMIAKPDLLPFRDLTAIGGLTFIAVGLLCTSTAFATRALRQKPHRNPSRRHQAEQLAHQANYDALTGLGNRNFFSKRLRENFRQKQPRGTLSAVLFIDLDEFKPVNDALGHHVGDALMFSIARRLREALKPGDSLARFGGDEFIILLPGLTSQREVEDFAETLLKTMARPHQVLQHDLHISASIGIALATETLNCPEKLIQQADMAMYRAKQQGRNTYEVFTADMDAAFARRVTLRNELQTAIEEEHLYLNYQPMVDHQGGVCGLEALVRWCHPTKGCVSPGDFISTAEQTGQIIPLGRWVTHRACRDALTLINLGLLPGPISVNLSPMQFHRSGFIRNLKQILAETGLPAGYLELELTEGILMKDRAGAIRILDTLRQMGVKTAIDDFGTGYSSFRYLRELPVDKIKIDRSFVTDVATNRKDAAVCKGIITLTRELNFRVVAEGVETLEQYDYLKQQGCEVFQGYYFARPMNLQSLIQWMADTPPAAEGQPAASVTRSTR